MIEQTFPSKRPKPTYIHSTSGPWFSPADIQQAQARKILPAEFVRRDLLIRKMFVECGWRPGDTAFPESKKDYEKHGAFMVQGVLMSYKDLAYDHDWPKSDVPLTITIKAMKDSKNILFCTPGWLVKKNLHIAVEC
ncbi:MAG: hypothetical protein WAV48_05015 [Candidatus Magasanikiibacteriota bacterium]